MSEMKSEHRWSKWVTGRRSKWITFIVWLVAAGMLSLFLPNVKNEVTNNAPTLSDLKPSVQASVIAKREFQRGTDIPALVVWHREAGLTDPDLQKLQTLTEKLTSQPVPGQTSVVPLHQMPLLKLKEQLSKDGSTLILPIMFDEQVDEDEMKASVTEVQERANAIFGSEPFTADTNSRDEVSARVTGPVGIQIDADALFGNADLPVMIGTVLLVLVLLLLIYRSPILAFIPLAAVGIAYFVITPILGWMASEGWIMVETQGTSIMTVLLFGAGTDYCLFLISRFRQVLKSEPDKSKALRSAMSDASGAIAMSGFTVVLSLVTLLAAEYGTFQRFAIPFSVAILIMGVASLTLVPAMLAIIGRSSFWPFVPRSPELQVEFARQKGKAAPAPEKAPRNRMSALVVKRPWLIVIVATLVLGGAAFMSMNIKYTYDMLSSFPKNMGSREGFAMIEKKFSPGQLAPIKVIVDTQGMGVPLGTTLASLPYVSEVSSPQVGKLNAQFVAYDIQLKMNPYAKEALEHIPDLRQVAAEALQSSGGQDSLNHVWLAGQTAEQYDTKVTTERDMWTIFPLIIGLIMILLFLYLRSLIATIYLIGTVLLSYCAALGFGWLIIHYVFGAEAIQGPIPMYTFVFLVALGEDYNIFMISSIWRKRKHMPLKQAIQEGVGETSSVISSAGLILAGTFAILVTMPIQMLAQIGTITTLGLLLDTFVVRPFLVPAITLLVGRWVFWPGKLHTPTVVETAATKVNI
jgi:RND superfamily putative drug exporter